MGLIYLCIRSPFDRVTTYFPCGSLAVALSSAAEVARDYPTLRGRVWIEGLLSASGRPEADAA